MSPEPCFCSGWLDVCAFASSLAAGSCAFGGSGSFIVRLKSRMVFPSASPSCGSLLGPKTSSAIARMMRR